MRKAFCDKCGEELQNGNSFSIRKFRKFSEAGNTFNIDLCDEHERKFYQFLNLDETLEEKLLKG